jgi:hypothetical protein
MRSGTFLASAGGTNHVATRQGIVVQDKYSGRYQYTAGQYNKAPHALYTNWRISTNNTGHGGSVFIAGTHEHRYPSIHRNVRKSMTGYDQPHTSKGMMFEVEPTDRARYGAHFSKTGSNGVATGPRSNNEDHCDELTSGSYTPHGESTAASINTAVYSGSLAFPYEMSPRRIARNQRFMLTVYTGTQTYGANFGGGQVQPNMYMFRPQQIRYTLFRLGSSHYHSRYQYAVGTFSDRTRMRLPNMSGTLSPAGSVDSRGQHGFMLHFAHQYSQLTAGVLHLKSTGHTTGTYGVYIKSRKHQMGSAEGFRYGLINTEPMNSSAVFRHDRYGQFRDMLEQRDFTRYFKKINRRRSFQRRRRSNNFVSLGPVTIRFKSTITDRRIKAVKTYSQNLSPTSTSSLPYFDADRDGKFRNRPYPFDDSSLDSAIVVEEDI